MEEIREDISWIKNHLILKQGVLFKRHHRGVQFLNRISVVAMFFLSNGNDRHLHRHQNIR